ncbi:DUF748 domain-containing protein [Pseudorhodoferax sp.]|uniref:DUF748 domain-containing protein n=1 Tax=Pseudorhodoferax sp. TaxID=1993553 RepID=UPI0039E4C6F3
MFAPLLSRLPPWLRRTLLVLLALAFIWSAGMLWVPAIVKPQAERGLAQALGRQVAIGAVEFRPWSLELTLRDLAVRTADGTGDQLHVAQIYANAALTSVWRLAPVLDALSVDQPRLVLRQQAPGQYDIDDILARLSAPSPEPKAESRPPSFALYNITLNGGSVDFEDAVVGQTHELRGLQLGVPFISNLPTYREVETEPRLAFQLNGSRFDSAAQSTPFVASRRTAASLRIADLDVKPYLGYLPRSLPARLLAGVLDADLQLEFEQTPAASVVLRGRLQAHGLQLHDGADGELLQVARIGVDIAELRPLEQLVKLQAVEIDAPQLQLRRDAAGRLNVAPSSAAGGAAPAPSTSASAAAPASAPASAATAAPAEAQAGWRVTLAKALLRDGRIGWRDAAAAPSGPPAELVLQQLSLSLEDVAYPFAQPARLQGSAELAGTGGAAPAQLEFQGQGTDQAADLRASIAQLRLQPFAAYLAGVLKPRLEGELSAELGVAWNAQGGLVVTAERATLAQLALKTEGAPQDIRALELRGARIDVAQRLADLGAVRIDRPRAAVARGADGRWMYEAWLQPQPQPQAAAAKAEDKPWTVALRSLAVEQGAVSFSDAAVPRPVALDLQALQVHVGALRSDQLKQPVPVELSVAVGAGRAAPGRLGLRGQLTPEPLVLQATLDAQKLPLHALEPYFGDTLNLELARADASFKGQLRYAAQAGGPALRVAGDLGVEDFRALQRGDRPARGRELLTWSVLRLRGLALQLAPGAATSVAVQDTALSDFYARVMIDETGRINLQDLVKSAPADAAPAAAGKAAAGKSEAGPPPSIRFGPIAVQGGRVLFSDRFIKPNYTANLTELQGRLSAFDSAGAAGSTPAMADLTLRGRAEGTAALEIDGKLNPLAKPLALDIRAKVRDLELPPLSPYSVKYAGHGIERGKLSVDVHYEVLPNGQLTASNSLVLNQLTFGDPVPGAPASLPVRLATALLADRNGVIDLNLPIQGSLNDPQFSLGPVILKAIGNLILKAVTAPFSLLAGAFGGGGEELGQVPFAAGSAVLDKPAEERLDKVARALADRPGLKLTVVGTASEQVEREGFKRARLARMVRAEKRRQSLAVGQRAAAGAADGAPVQVGADEYPALLKAIYQRADLKDKPRNAIGLAKDLPVPEMEQLLLDAMTVPDDAMRDLAVQRSVAVRDYLASRQVAADRMFLGAPKTVDGGAGWSPHAQLELATP